MSKSEREWVEYKLEGIECSSTRCGAILEINRLPLRCPYCGTQNNLYELESTGEQGSEGEDE